MTRITLRLDFPNGERLGPGKVLLLEQIRATGSISAAGRSVGMSYRRAWQLADSLNRTFREPVVVTRLGGEHGGGAGLTAFGEHLLEVYRRMEALTRDVVAAPLALLEQDLAENG